MVPFEEYIRRNADCSKSDIDIFYKYIRKVERKAFRNTYKIIGNISSLSGTFIKHGQPNWENREHSKPCRQWPEDLGSWVDNRMIELDEYADKNHPKNYHLYWGATKSKRLSYAIGNIF